MPYRRKDSPVWWVSLTDSSGKRIRLSTETTSRKEAEALEAKWKLAAFQQKQWDTQPVRTFEELMVVYLSAVSEKRSFTTDQRRTKTLRRFFNKREMNSLRPKDIRAYIDWRKASKVSNATINRELSLLSAAINFVNRDLDWMLPNPVTGRKLKEPQGRLRWLSKAEAAALIQAAERIPRSPFLADFIRLALHTGCRSGELRGLRWDQVSLPDRLIHLRAEDTKAGRPRSIPLNDVAYQAMLNRLRFRAQYCPDSPWVIAKKNGDSIECLKKGFRSACQQVGITDFRIHDMRHTCAAWLVSNGVPLAEIRDLLGHQSVVTTERYAHLAPANLRTAVDALVSRFGHVGSENYSQKHSK